MKIGAIALSPSANGVSLQRYFELVTTVAERNIKARYRGSFLGVFWSLSNPLIMTGLYTLIFGTAFASYYGGSILNYVLAVFMGLVAVTFFSQTSSQALSSIVANGSLINKIRIPLSVFPISIVVANLFQFLVGVIPVIVLVTLFASHSVERVLLLAAPAAALLLVTIGASLAVSALFVFFRDLPYIYELIVFIIWITSPIFYPEEIVPAHLRIWVHINPISAIANDIRQIAFSPVAPHLAPLAATVGLGIATALIGAVTFLILGEPVKDLL